MNIINLDTRPEWNHLVAAWLHEEFRGVDRRYGTVESTEQTLVHSDRYLTVVAVVDNKPVGCASFVRSDLPIRPHLEGWLADLYVVPKFRCRGIGTALIARCVGFARETRGRIFLFTEDQEQFYAKRGWRVVERTVFDEHEITIMEIGL